MANQIDTQKAIGLTLISLLLIIYMYFFAPKPTPQVQNPPPTTTAELPQTQHILPNDQTYIPPSTQACKQKEEKEYVLENNMMQITFSTRGGMIKKVWLKQYKTYLQEPLVLIDSQSSHMKLKISTAMQNIDTSQHFFHAYNQEVEVDKEATKILIIFHITCGIDVNQ